MDRPCVLHTVCNCWSLTPALLLLLLVTDTGIAAAGAEAQEGSVPAGCSPAPCHTGVGQTCRRPAGCSIALPASCALHSSTGIGNAIPDSNRLWCEQVDRNEL